MAALRGAFWLVAILIVFGWLMSDNEPHDTSRNPSPNRPIIAPQPDATFHKSRPPERPTVPVSSATWLYATANVRLRAAPHTAADIYRTLFPGEPVQLIASDGVWRQIVAGRQTGWVHGDYLARNKPVIAPPTPPAAFVQRRTSTTQGPTGAPIRSPYTGRCDCPYDRKRNGHRCGGTSAWSRPGGRSPICYVGE